MTKWTMRTRQVLILVGLLLASVSLACGASDSAVEHAAVLFKRAPDMPQPLHDFALPLRGAHDTFAQFFRRYFTGPVHACPDAKQQHVYIQTKFVLQFQAGTLHTLCAV